MSIRVVFECDGCFAKADGRGTLRTKFRSITGRGYGFGSWHWNTVDTIAPAGWIASDPHTGCCYCPECWQSIIEDTVAEEAPG